MESEVHVRKTIIGEMPHLQALSEYVAEDIYTKFREVPVTIQEQKGTMDFSPASELDVRSVTTLIDALSIIQTIKDKGITKDPRLLTNAYTAVLAAAQMPPIESVIMRGGSGKRRHGGGLRVRSSGLLVSKIAYEPMSRDVGTVIQSEATGDVIISQEFPNYCALTLLADCVTDPDHPGVDAAFAERIAQSVPTFFRILAPRYMHFNESLETQTDGAMQLFRALHVASHVVAVATGVPSPRATAVLHISNETEDMFIRSGDAGASIVVTDSDGVVKGYSLPPNHTTALDLPIISASHAARLSPAQSVHDEESDVVRALIRNGYAQKFNPLDRPGVGTFGSMEGEGSILEHTELYFVRNPTANRTSLLYSDGIHMGSYLSISQPWVTALLLHSLIVLRPYVNEYMSQTELMGRFAAALGLAGQIPLDIQARGSLDDMSMRGRTHGKFPVLPSSTDQSTLLDDVLAGGYEYLREDIRRRQQSLLSILNTG